MKIKIKHIFNHFEKYIKQFLFIILSLAIIAGGFTLFYLGSNVEPEQLTTRIIMLLFGTILSFIGPPLSLCLYSKFFL
ncbi:MAG: hypothetical protein ACRC4M_02345, partial [Mycoplasma sp.]